MYLLYTDTFQDYRLLSPLVVSKHTDVWIPYLALAWLFKGEEDWSNSLNGEEDTTSEKSSSCSSHQNCKDLCSQFLAPPNLLAHSRSVTSPREKRSQWEEQGTNLREKSAAQDQCCIIVIYPLKMSPTLRSVNPYWCKCKRGLNGISAMH